MTDAEDKKLVRRCLDGDEQAFAALMRRYEKIVFNIALQMVKEEEDARDVAQTAFIKAYEKLDTYNPDYKFFSWLYRIAYNESLNALAKRKWYDELNSGIMSEEETPETIYEETSLDDQIRAALQELSEKDRAIIVLKHFLHLTLVEIGDILDIPAKTVKSRLFSARQRLGGILSKRGVKLA